MARPKLAPSSSHWRSALLAAPARVRLEQTISQSNHMEGDPEAPRRNYATSGMQRVNPNLCLRQRVPGVRARANLDRRLAVLPPSARPSSVRRRPGSSSPPQEKILKTYILLHFITFYYIFESILGIALAAVRPAQAFPIPPIQEPSKRESSLDHKALDQPTARSILCLQPLPDPTLTYPLSAGRQLTQILKSHHLNITAPPATSSTTPVIRLESSEARNSAARAISSGVPRRLIGCAPTIEAFWSSGIR